MPPEDSDRDRSDADTSKETPKIDRYDQEATKSQGRFYPASQRYHDPAVTLISQCNSVEL